MVSTTPPTKASPGATHSDLAFSGKYAIQGNYNGFEIWDISNPAKPALVNAFNVPHHRTMCPSTRTCSSCPRKRRTAASICKFGGIAEPISEDRVRGIRIFDIADPKRPKLVTSVQTCRGSHTHTVVTQPGDNDNVYIYVSGTAGVRGKRNAGLPGWRYR